MTSKRSRENRNYISEKGVRAENNVEIIHELDWVNRFIQFMPLIQPNKNKQ